MRLDEFNFELPSNLIADKLTLPRDNCKLCIVKNNILQDMYFYEIKKFFNKGDILILNNSKVLRSFIEIKSNNFHKNNISINLHTQVDNNLWLAFCKNSKKVAIGDKFKFDSHILKVIKKNPMGEILLQFELDKISIENFLDKYAKMPIPDYIIKARKKNKTTIKNENNQNISQEIDTNQVNDEAYLELNIDKQESDI
ncbi:MAG: S-adenosylmethionine:tRNA ribosyltransferase-isomerase, partial [Rickettsiales bacterium]